MFSADVLTLREFMRGEPFPLATRQQAVLECLRGRDDVVVFVAQAVNAYVNEPRMTHDRALLSTPADVVAQELGAALRQRFPMAVSPDKPQAPRRKCSRRGRQSSRKTDDRQRKTRHVSPRQQRRLCTGTGGFWARLR